MRHKIRSYDLFSTFFNLHTTDTIYPSFDIKDSILIKDNVFMQHIQYLYNFQN